MKTHTVFVLAIYSLPLAAGADEIDVQGESKKLQGAWTMTALEVNGENVPENKLEETTLTIEGRRYITTVKGKQHEATFKIDPSKKPKWIDMTLQDGPGKGQLLKGIYELKGDTLRICRGLSMFTARPEAFRTEAGSQLFIVTWTRKR